MAKPQTYNDGLCSVYSLENVAEPGDTPVEMLVPKLPALRYQMRTVGVNRFWNAMQENTRIDFVVRVQRQLGVSNQDVCILRDGQQYRIKQVQHPMDIVPPSTDLSLERIAKSYKIAPVT